MGPLWSVEASHHVAAEQAPSLENKIA